MKDSLNDFLIKHKRRLFETKFRKNQKLKDDNFICKGFKSIQFRPIIKNTLDGKLIKNYDGDNKKITDYF